jgi:hypothetical protein
MDTGNPWDNQRKSKRLTITVPRSVYDFVVEQSFYEGRSISNLIAYLLETQIDQIRRGDK